MESQGRRRFEFQQGPIFTNLLLADEINRATPKTQAALFEALEEGALTVANERYNCPSRSSPSPRRAWATSKARSRCRRRSWTGSSSSCAWPPPDDAGPGARSCRRMTEPRGRAPEAGAETATASSRCSRRLARCRHRRPTCCRPPCKLVAARIPDNAGGSGVHAAVRAPRRQPARRPGHDAGGQGAGPGGRPERRSPARTCGAWPCRPCGTACR